MKPDPRQESLGWKTAAPATLPPEIDPPADSKAVRSLRDFERLRKTLTETEPCYVRLMNAWEPADATGFYYDNPDEQTGPRVTVRICKTGSRLEIRNREYLRTRDPKGGGA